MTQFVCPRCGCGDIAELRLCVVSHPVAKWSNSGEPEDYEEAAVDWESDMAYLSPGGSETPREVTLECSQCGEQFEKPRRVNRPRRARVSPDARQAGS
ncbi:MAG: hypothetical protein WA005_14325 [Candidatus Binataceae bacterium]